MSISKFKLSMFLFLLCTAMINVACNDDDDSTPEIQPSIVDIAVDDANLSSLVEALSAANLVNTLNGSGPFTVFAPTNDAFQALLDTEPTWNTIADIPVDVLTQVLLMHVLSGETASSDLTDTYVTSLSTGPNGENISFQIEVTGGIEFNGDAKPITTDIDARNGVIHTIDKVMLPPNVVNLAVNNENFSILVAALTDSRLSTDYVSVLSGTGPFTIFAPTNDAFQALLDSNPAWNGLSDIPVATLDAVLQYHVVGASVNVQSDELTDNQGLTMLNQGTATIQLDSGAQIVTSSDQTVNIIITDVQGTNGVIHAVDQVLLP